MAKRKKETPPFNCPRCKQPIVEATVRKDATIVTEIEWSQETGKYVDVSTQTYEDTRTILVECDRCGHDLDPADALRFMEFTDIAA